MNKLYGGSHSLYEIFKEEFFDYISGDDDSGITFNERGSTIAWRMRASLWLAKQNEYQKVFHDKSIPEKKRKAMLKKLKEEIREIEMSN